MEYYVARKNNEVLTDTCSNTDKPWEHHAKWKKSDTEGHIIYDSICIKCLELANL